MPSKVKKNPNQPSMLDNYGKTAPAVPAIRQAVGAYLAAKYPAAFGGDQRRMTL